MRGARSCASPEPSLAARDQADLVNRAGARPRAPRRAGRRCRTCSPTAGTRPRCVSRIAADRLEPFALDLHARAAAPTSSMSTLPLKTNRPPPSSTIGSDSTSYSSRISPTISSSRSSMVTSPAVPPYSSTTIAICVCCRWNCFSSSGTRLLSGTTTAGRSSGVIGRASSAALERDQILHEHEARDVVEALLEDREPRVLLLAEQRAQIADRRAPPGCATMSGRGVMTSRTSVSPKSTMLCSSRRSSPSMRPSCSPVSRYALRGLGRLLRRSRPAPCAPSDASARPTRAVQRDDGPSALATGLNDGSSSSSTRSGSRPTISSGSSSSKTTTNAGDADDDQRARSRHAVDADRHGQERRRRRRDRGRAAAGPGANSRTGSSRYVGERVRAGRCARRRAAATAASAR